MTDDLPSAEPEWPPPPLAVPPAPEPYEPGRRSGLSLPAEGPAAPPPVLDDRQASRRWRRAMFVVGAVLVVGYLISFIRLPYFVISPGPAEDVEPLIHIRGTQTYPSQGHLLLTAVDLQQANLYGVIDGWLDPAKSVVPERQILAPGQSQEQELEVARSQMDTSKIDAAVVALTQFAGYPADHRPGALVEQVFPGTPAEGKLFPGDLIVEVNGKPVTGPDDLGPAISAAGEGGNLTLTVRAAGKTRTVTLSPARVTGVDHPIIGVSVVANFPFPLTIDSGDIGGPSAGLMWALGVSDLLTPGDMTDGRTVAGTGTISLEGKVGPIGGVEEKVVAAERAGATVFLVPVEDAAGARSVARHITIVPVGTFDQALRYFGQTV